MNDFMNKFLAEPFTGWCWYFGVMGCLGATAGQLYIGEYLFAGGAAVACMGYYALLRDYHRRNRHEA
jgi:hypothetical protein